MKQTIQTLRLGLTMLLLAASSIPSQAAPPHTGIRGQAFLHISYGVPIEVAPGVWIGIPSVQLPVVTSFTILSARSGREVGHVTTDANGAFEMSLPPGKYVVVPDNLTMPFGGSIQTGSFEVTLNAKEFTPTFISYFHAGPFTIFGNLQ